MGEGHQEEGRREVDRKGGRGDTDRMAGTDPGLDGIGSVVQAAPLSARKRGQVNELDDPRVRKVLKMYGMIRMVFSPNIRLWVSRAGMDRVVDGTVIVVPAAKPDVRRRGQTNALNDHGARSCLMKGRSIWMIAGGDVRPRATTGRMNPVVLPGPGPA